MMKILVSYRGAQRIRGWETGALVADAFRELGHDVDEYARIYETTEWVQEKGSFSTYDLVLNMECNDPEPQYFDLANVRTVKRAMWHFDYSYYPQQALLHIDGYNPRHLFMANKYYINQWPSCSWLPYAACPEKHIRPISSEKKIDVALVGTERPERRQLIDHLNRIGIKSRLVTDVFKEDYVDVLASARIVINENPQQGKGLLNMRTFEAVAAGALLITGDPEVADVFTPGQDVLVYNDKHELAIYIRAMMTNHVERIDMVKAAQDRLKSEHLYEHRAQEILDVLF